MYTTDLAPENSPRILTSAGMPRVSCHVISNDKAVPGHLRHLRELFNNPFNPF